MSHLDYFLGLNVVLSPADLFQSLPLMHQLPQRATELSRIYSCVTDVHAEISNDKINTHPLRLCSNNIIIGLTLVGLNFVSWASLAIISLIYTN